MSYFRLFLVLIVAMFVYLIKGTPRKSWNFTYYAFVRVIRSILQVPETNDPKKLLEHLNKVRKQLDKNYVPFEHLKKRKQFKNLVYGELEIDRLDNELARIYPATLPESPSTFYAEWCHISEDATMEDFKDILSNENIKIVLFCHGGAYSLMSCKSHRFMTTQISRYTKFAVVSIDYRLAPENPFPAGLFDAISAFIWLMRNGVRPDRIVFAGDSAGGGLTFALMLFLKDYREEIKQAFNIDPSGIFAYIGLSPWLDLTMNGASVDLNSKSDYLTSPADLHGLNTGWLYVGGMDIIPRLREPGLKEEMDSIIRRNPYISPVCYEGSFDDLPPILIISGGAELILSDTLLMYGLISGNISHNENDDIHRSPWLLETTAKIIDWDLRKRSDNKFRFVPLHENIVNKIRVEIYHDQVHVFMAFPMVQHRRMAYENLQRWTDSLINQTDSPPNGLFMVH